MSENLLKSLTETISPSLMGKMGSILGESDGNLQSGIASALPSLLASVVNKGSTEDGASGLMNFISENKLDGSLLGNLTGALDNDSSGLMDQGSNILNFLMGNKSSGVFSLLSKVTGLGSNSSGGIMKMLAPIVMSLIGKKVMSNGLGVSGLMGLLTDQKDHLKGSLPTGMSGVMGLANSFTGMFESGKDAVGNAGKAVAGAAGSVAGSAASGVKGVAGAAASVAGSAASGVKGVAGSAVETGKSATGRLWPWIIGILCLLAAVYLIRSCGGTGIAAVDNMAEKTTEMVDNATEATGDAIGDVAEGTVGAVKSIGSFISDNTLAALGKLKFAAGSAGEQFYDWIKDGGEGEKAFIFKYLNFPTGGATISAEGKSELDNIASILTEIKDINVEISGHTDNTGDQAANLSLSQNRADAIKAYLTSKGIADGRLVSKGYGSTQPIGDNATEEGRASNRRSEVRVMFDN